MQNKLGTYYAIVKLEDSKRLLQELTGTRYYDLHAEAFNRLQFRLMKRESDCYYFIKRFYNRKLAELGINVRVI